MMLFVKNGYHGTSTTDICRAVGISYPTLYWYFNGKEDLLFSMHKDSIEKTLRPMLARVRPQKDPIERLSSFIDEFTHTICSDPAVKIMIKETEYLEPDHQKVVKSAWKESLDLIRNSILELEETDKAREVAATFVAFGLLGMITWGYTWFDSSRPETIQKLAETTKEVFFAGILKPGVAWRPHT